MEVHMGDFEDKNWSIYKLPKGDGVPYRHRRFPHGESRHDAYLRVSTFIEDLFTEYPVDQSSDINILLVAHGMVLTEVSNVIHSRQKIPWDLIRWHNTAVTTIQINAKGLDVLENNDTSHLEHLVRQIGGIGSTSHDPTQAKLTGYFGKTA
jgi:broad specificity phosphatase PhoE